MGLPHMGLTKIYKSGSGPDEPAKKPLTCITIKVLITNYGLLYNFVKIETVNAAVTVNKSYTICSKTLIIPQILVWHSFDEQKVVQIYKIN